MVTGNTNTYLNIVQGGVSIGSSTQITGAGSITVTSDAAGKLTITGNTNYLPLTGGTLTGNLTAPTFIGSLTGNASTATSANSVSLHSGDEINLGGSLNNGSRLYVNYNDGGNFTEYGFYGGGTALANIFAASFVGPLTGNATTATTLATSRTI